LQEQQNQLFWDAASGGYFTSPEGDPSIVLRLKEDQVKLRAVPAQKRPPCGCAKALRPGADVLIFKIFLPKNSAKKFAFFTQN
jgi:hypothetical protein